MAEPRRPPPPRPLGKPPIPPPPSYNVTARRRGASDVETENEISKAPEKPPVPPPKDSRRMGIQPLSSGPEQVQSVSEQLPNKSARREVQSMTISPSIADLIAKFQAAQTSPISPPKPHTPDKPGRLRAASYKFNQNSPTPSPRSKLNPSDVLQELDFQERRRSIAAALEKPAISPKPPKKQSLGSNDLRESPSRAASNGSIVGNEDLSGDSVSEHWSSDPDPSITSASETVGNDTDDTFVSGVELPPPTSAPPAVPFEEEDEDTLSIPQFSPALEAEEFAPTQATNTDVNVDRPITPLPSGLTTPTLTSSARFENGGPLNLPIENSQWEEKRKKKRNNIIRELVDTEGSFARDMRVLQDVYIPNSRNVLSPDDVRLIFGQVDTIYSFSHDFHQLLQLAAGLLYDLEGDETRSHSDAVENSTWIGSAFNQSMAQLEKIYTEFCANHETVARRRFTLASDKHFQNYCERCEKESQHLTSAWNLESLLIKPVQRVLKYPLLLVQLLECTKPEHTDYTAIKKASDDIQSAADRINETKKRRDLVDKISGRNRSDSDRRRGFSKGLGRRKERIRQTVGLSEEYVDDAYETIIETLRKQRMQIQIIIHEFENYLKTLDAHLAKVCEFFKLVDQWLEIEITPYQQLQSKWDYLRLVLEDIATARFATHIQTVRLTVIAPLTTVYELYEKPRRIMAKRDKKVLDFVRYNTIKDRGERPDKRVSEAAEVFTAINTSLLEELPMFFTLTEKVVRGSLEAYCRALETWNEECKSALESALPMLSEDAETSWAMLAAHSSDIDNCLTALSICNGSLVNNDSHDGSGKANVSPEESLGFLPRRSRSFSDGASDMSIWRNSDTSTTPRPQTRFRSASSNFAPNSANEDTDAASSILAPRVSSDGSSSEVPESTTLFTCASMASNKRISKTHQHGYPYLRYSKGEIFSVLGEKENLYLARVIDGDGELGWISGESMVKLM